jgi:hypothetical protein
VNGLKTIAFIVDKKRFDRLMSLIAMGLHFHHFQQKWSKPIIIESPSLINIGNINVNRDLQSLDGMAIQFLGEVPPLGNHPEIFSYQIHRGRNPDHLVVRMVFYGGIIVFASSSDQLSDLLN